VASGDDGSSAGQVRERRARHGGGWGGYRSGFRCRSAGSWRVGGAARPTRHANSSAGHATSPTCRVARSNNYCAAKSARRGRPRVHPTGRGHVAGAGLGRFYAPRTGRRVHAVGAAAFHLPSGGAGPRLDRAGSDPGRKRHCRRGRPPRRRRIDLEMARAPLRSRYRHPARPARRRPWPRCPTRSTDRRVHPHGRSVRRRPGRGHPARSRDPGPALWHPGRRAQVGGSPLGHAPTPFGRPPVRGPTRSGTRDPSRTQVQYIGAA
jgi:hypothetical protein